MRYPFFPFKLDQKDNNSFVIQSPYKKDGSKINSSAACILDLCDGSKSVGDIAHIVSKRFRLPATQVSQRTRQFVQDLSERGLLWLRNDRIRWYNAPPPESIFWEITAACNLRCKHCVVSADRKLEGELTTEQCLRLINEWSQMGVREVTFSGGEPLLRDDFFALAWAVKNENMVVSLATNGTLITERLARRLKALDTQVQVSLDGSNPDVYGRVRGKKAAFDKAIRGIRHLLSAGVEVTVGMVVTKKNAHDIPAMTVLVEEMKVPYFRLIPFIPSGRGKANAEMELTPGKVQQITRDLFQKRRDLPFEVLPMEFEHTFHPPPEQHIDPRRPSECGGAIHYCTVTPEGEVLPCHYFKGVVTDTVKEHSFAWIWCFSRFLNYFRSMQIGDIKGFCQRCNWLSICRGGCKAANFSRGSLFEANCHCWIASANEQSPAEPTNRSASA